MAMVRHLEVYQSAIYQASSGFEESDIRAALGDGALIRKVEVVVASDLPNPVLNVAAGTCVVALKEPGKLRVVFLSRISPKKNLLGALRLLKDVSGSIEFSIYGPQEDGAYWDQCLKQIRLLPPNIKVIVHPQIEHSAVGHVMRAHHVFLFPTLGENFGHVIYEALAAGVPIVISDRTPWRGLEKDGAGWDLPLEREDLFRRALEDCVAMDSQQFRVASEAARSVACRFVNGSNVIAANRALFQPPVPAQAGVEAV